MGLEGPWSAWSERAREGQGLALVSEGRTPGWACGESARRAHLGRLGRMKRRDRVCRLGREARRGSRIISRRKIHQSPSSSKIFRNFFDVDANARDCQRTRMLRLRTSACEITQTVLHLTYV